MELAGRRKRGRPKRMQWERTWQWLKWWRRMQMIGPDGDEKSAVATPNGSGRMKTKKVIGRLIFSVDNWTARFICSVIRKDGLQWKCPDIHKCSHNLAGKFLWAMIYCVIITESALTMFFIMRAGCIRIKFPVKGLVVESGAYNYPVYTTNRCRAGLVNAH